MTERPSTANVRCWQEQITIPTYPVQDADPNPIFLEKRVYQGSSGKVYPNPFIDRVAIEKVDKTYDAIFLENEFIQLMILPEIGGRIHAGLDKTNHYDFFYRQHVIKPALVGLLGPWISGGVEFNWPQHHRPSTYMPVHAATEQYDDGSCTVWLSEHDPMLRMKGMVGIHLAPGKAIVEAKVRLFNRTSLPQTFLWWANVAVHVNDQYQAFFPPDVTFVADHAKRAITSFPIARESYYGVDYSPGTDISWYKNIPVPTSYMVTQSKYDFCGGYDHGREAGIIHTSNHHVAPGKKLWTWGNAEFGYAWDRHLTDEDGPYIELMAGAYTDNQPDFSWLQPYETKTFSQYWYPIQKIGPAKNANTRAAVNLEFDTQSIRVGVAATSRLSVRVLLTSGGKTILDERVEIAPGAPFVEVVKAAGVDAEGLRLSVLDGDGNEIIAWQPEKQSESTLPDAAKESPAPEAIATNEELYLTGLHLEQYRHATRSADDYWREGLRRDPGDVRINNAVGLAHLRVGEFAQADVHFARAIARLTEKNPNPRDGEVYYNLGLAQVYQGKLSEAYGAFHKCVWNYAQKSAGYLALASISTERGELHLALKQVELSLQTNGENLSALALRVALLRHLRREDDATAEIARGMAIDPLCFRMIAEKFLLSGAALELKLFLDVLHGDVQMLLDVGFELAWCGLRNDAFTLLEACVREGGFDHPMLWYSLAWLTGLLGSREAVGEYAKKAEAASSLYCFPARLEEMIVLESAIALNPSLARAHYHLGNLYYDKRRYEDAIRCWRRSIALDDTFSIPFRNLGIAEFNVLHNAQAAAQMYERAIELAPHDARVLYELDQLKKRAGLSSPVERLKLLSEHKDLVAHRDDLTVEYITLLNQTGQWEAALEHLNSGQFNPWEGGEGMVSGQYVHAHRALALDALVKEEPNAALQHLESARHYPQNLGEGKHLLTEERDLDYFSGLAALEAGDKERAEQSFSAAAAPLATASAQAYFQALALLELGREDAAREVFMKLKERADKLLATKPVIDYFATSLPNLLLFDDDLDKRNQVHALLLSALADDGMGKSAEAMAQLEQVLAADANHLFAAEMLQWLKSRTVAIRSWPAKS